MMQKSTNWGVSVLSALMLAAGGGYVQSGTWEDDPANWTKPFRSTKPEDVDSALEVLAVGSLELRGGLCVRSGSQFEAPRSAVQGE
jgi:hypothetical protein